MVEARSPFGGTYGNLGRANPYGASRFDEAPSTFASSYDTPGWKRARQQSGGNFGSSAPFDRSKAAAAKRRSAGPITIDGELIASSTAKAPGYAKGSRVRHQKFGAGTVEHVDGNKLTIAFDAGDKKRVVASFVDPE